MDNEKLDMTVQEALSENREAATKEALRIAEIEEAFNELADLGKKWRDSYSTLEKFLFHRGAFRDDEGRTRPIRLRTTSLSEDGDEASDQRILYAEGHFRDGIEINFAIALEDGDEEEGRLKHNFDFSDDTKGQGVAHEVFYSATAIPLHPQEDRRRFNLAKLSAETPLGDIQAATKYIQGNLATLKSTVKMLEGSPGAAEVLEQLADERAIEERERSDEDDGELDPEEERANKSLVRRILGVKDPQPPFRA